LTDQAGGGEDRGEIDPVRVRVRSRQGDGADGCRMRLSGVVWPSLVSRSLRNGRSGIGRHGSIILVVVEVVVEVFILVVVVVIEIFVIEVVLKVFVV